MFKAGVDIRLVTYWDKRFFFDATCEFLPFCFLKEFSAKLLRVS